VVAILVLVVVGIGCSPKELSATPFTTNITTILNIEYLDFSYKVVESALNSANLVVAKATVGVVKVASIDN